jgi:hypothetical protein
MALTGAKTHNIVIVAQCRASTTSISVQLLTVATLSQVSAVNDRFWPEAAVPEIDFQLVGASWSNALASLIALDLRRLSGRAPIPLVRGGQAFAGMPSIADAVAAQGVSNRSLKASFRKRRCCPRTPPDVRVHDSPHKNKGSVQVLCHALDGTLVASSP